MNAITDTRHINKTTYMPISFKVENENICIEVSVTDSRIHELSVEGKTNQLSREIGKILTHELIGLPLADFLSMGSMILLEKTKRDSAMKQCLESSLSQIALTLFSKSIN